MDEIKQIAQWFHPKVVIRKEGHEYLLYNRTTDQLMMLSETGVQLLRLYAKTKSIKGAAIGYAKSVGKISKDVELQVQDFLFKANKAGILNNQLAGLPDIQSLRPPDSERSFQNLRPLGDLTLSAWAIAAKTFEANY